MGKCLSGICGSYPAEPIVKQGLALDTKRNIHHCVTLLDMDGAVRYYDLNNSDILVARVHPTFEYNDVEVVAGTPYYQILPCPFCSTQTDRDHDPLLHVNPKLGTRS